MAGLVIAWVEGGVIHDIDDDSTAALLLIDDEDISGVDADDCMIIHYDGRPSKEDRMAYVTLRDRYNWTVMCEGKTMAYSALKELARKTADKWEKTTKKIEKA